MLTSQPPKFPQDTAWGRAKQWEPYNKIVAITIC